MLAFLVCSFTLSTTLGLQPKEVTFSLSVFVATVAGVACFVAVVFSVVCFALGGVTVHWSNRQRAKVTTGASTPTQSPPSVPAEARGQVTPEYEEISLQEIKDLQLTSNTAYGVNKT